MIKVQDLDEAQCLKGLRYNVNVGKGATAVSTVLVCNAVCTVAQCLKRLKYNVNVGKGATAVSTVLVCNAVCTCGHGSLPTQ